MNVLALIPARGGSRRIPGKNLIDLGGKPLIAWTIERARRLGLHVAVSTDSLQIANAARIIDPEIDVIERPHELARDETPTLPVAVHAAGARPGFDAIAVLQATSPFCDDRDLSIGLQMMLTNDPDAVVSYVEHPEPDSLATLGLAGRVRRASPAGPVFAPNGAFHIMRSAWILAGGGWYDGVVYGHVMPAWRSLDIDTHSDLERAREKVFADNARKVVI